MIREYLINGQQARERHAKLQSNPIHFHLDIWLSYFTGKALTKLKTRATAHLDKQLMHQSQRLFPVTCYLNVRTGSQLLTAAHHGVFWWQEAVGIL